MPRLADTPLPEELVPFVQAFGISRPTVAILVALRDGKPASFVTIQDRAQVPAGSLSGLLSHLEALGFIRANTPPSQRKGRRDVLWEVDATALESALTAFHDGLIVRHA